MATSAKKVATGTFLPPSVVAALKRGIWAVAGFGILGVVLAATIALVTYSYSDPSLNTATDSTVQNWLAAPGAIFADATLQALGLAVTVPIFIIASWGVRVMRAETVSWLWLRTASIPVAALLLSIGLSGFSQPTEWSLPAGLGGFSGHILMDLFAISLSGIGDIESLRWLAVLFGLLGGISLSHW
ncbi:MAG: DNA translocase FtsK 4TM domain-containing protein, partial [Rhodospirillales bacterium]